MEILGWKLLQEILFTLESIVIFNALTPIGNVLCQMQNIYQFYILLIFTKLKKYWGKNWKDA